MNFWVACKSCFLFSGSIFYFAYAVFVLALSFIKFRGKTAGGSNFDGSSPPLPGELEKVLPAPRINVITQILALLVGIANFDNFRALVAAVVRFIRVVFLMNDNPSLLKSLWRYLNLYLIIIPLPAAFLAPVLHPQREPDAELLVAGVLTIIVNAIGDLISVRLILRTFETLHFCQASGQHTANQEFWRNARNEAIYYLNVLKGAGYSLCVLVVVLALSSVFFGVQIGEIEFELSSKFFVGAWHRILEFPSLAFEPYWFRHQAGPFGTQGVPGLFLFGVITFVPIIILGVLAAAWLILLPFRIAVTLPTGPVARIATSEASVLFLCIVFSYFEQVDLLGIYRFLFKQI